MSKQSRQRFRPTWMGSVNAMRDKYIEGNARMAAFDIHYAEVRRHEMTCVGVYTVRSLPARDDFESVQAWLNAYDEFLALEASGCICTKCGGRRW